jgi:hypothetical protein
MMSEPAKKVAVLKVAEDNFKKELLEHFDETVKKAREFMDANPASGFVVLTYTKEDKESAYVAADYHLYDPFDSFWLPHMVKAKLEKLRDHGHEDE